MKPSKSETKVETAADHYEMGSAALVLVGPAQFANGGPGFIAGRIGATVWTAFNGEVGEMLALGLLHDPNPDLADFISNNEFATVRIEGKVDGRLSVAQFHKVNLREAFPNGAKTALVCARAIDDSEEAAFGGSPEAPLGWIWAGEVGEAASP